MAQIKVDGLNFQYPGSADIIFDNVSFAIDTDWKLGFIGRNGRGKTTFLNILQNRLEYAGKINGNVVFEYFPFAVEEKNDLTINIIEQVDPEYEQWRIERELSLLRVDSSDVLYRTFNTLSNGEQTKVLLSVLFAKENRFLLIDEPTNHLDAEGRQIVAQYLSSKKGFILVSHDRHFLDACVDHILSINRTNIEVMQGNFSMWWENKENRDRFEADENERLKKDITRLEKAAKRTEVWSDQVEKTKIGTSVADRGFVGHKAAKMMQRSKNISARVESAIEEKKGLLKNIEVQSDLKLFPVKHHANPIVAAQELAINYDEKPVISDLTFDLKQGEILALEGKNGSGKSSLIKLIMGEDIAHTGIIRVASGLKISYIPQDSSDLSGTLDEFIQANDLDPTLFMTILRKFDMKRDQFTKPLSAYSAGQKKKVYLAKSLCEQAHLYIWDEPMNYIDVFSRMQIERVIQTYKPTMLLVEHDKAFMQHIATKMISL